MNLTKTYLVGTSSLLFLLASTSALAADPGGAAKVTGQNPAPAGSAAAGPAGAAGKTESKPLPARPRLSNYEFFRAEFGGWYTTGDYPVEFDKVARYSGGGGGLHLNGNIRLNRYFAFDFDARLALSSYGGQGGKADMKLEVGSGFSGARWAGRMPGSFVFGLGAGASLGHPIWLDTGAAIYPLGFARFMVKFSDSVRLQMDYRFSPISTQLYFYEAWVMAQDAAVSLGYEYWHFGVRGRIEDTALRSNFDQNLRSFWIGGFFAIVYN